MNNCEFRNNNTGVQNDSNSSTNSNIVIENSRFAYTNCGVIPELGAANVSIRNAVFANNGVGVLAFSDSPSQPVLIVVDTCTIAHNTTGMKAQAFTGASATIRVTNSTIDHNGDGMLFYNPGAIESYGNNRVTANTANSTFSGTVLPLQ